METTVKSTTKAQSAKVASPGNDLNYKSVVLGSNAALKAECKKVGFALRVIKSTDGVHDALKALARKAEKDAELYALIDKGVRRSKSGNTSPFYVMQFLYKSLQK